MNCPRCGSPKNHRRGYYNFVSGKFQKRKCNNCGKIFKAELVEAGTKVKPTVLEPEKTPEPKPIPSIDSIVKVPCFICSEQNRGCRPEFCSKLTSFLVAPKLLTECEVIV